jgi:DNA repair protein RadC
MHEGHRQRLRERYIKTGPDGFMEHELLELLLTYAIPRRNTNDIAHSLISRFGSLSSVLCADAAELSSIDGVGDSTAVFLRLVGDAGRKAVQSNDRKAPLLGTPAAAVSFALELLAGERYESVYVVSLDKNMRLLHAERLLTGTLTEAPLYPRRVVESALHHRAHAVLLLHNHPSGDPSPSESDAQATEAVKKALNSIDIRLFDHIIVGRNAAYSFSRGISIAQEDTQGLRAAPGMPAEGRVPPAEALLAAEKE